jgi:hypothetical protein
MTGERAQAYGRVMRTLAELGPSKLLPDEEARVRDAADTLLFAEELEAGGALEDVRALIEHLVSTERWSEERAQRLAADLEACGPVTLVG